jgi:hypothetical protein
VVLRSKLWDPAAQLDRAALPSLGTILQELSRGQINGEQYDRELPGRLVSTPY